MRAQLIRPDLHIATIPFAISLTDSNSGLSSATAATTLAPLFSYLRVAVLVAVSSLTILLAAATFLFLLRY